MTGPIVFISHNRIKDGMFDAFQKHYRDSVPPTETNKPDTLVQVAYVNEDTTAVTIVRVFPDAAALDRQLEGAGERSRAAYQFIEPAGIEIYGLPSDLAVQQMKSIAGSGIDVRLYPEFIGGFIRFGLESELGPGQKREGSASMIAANRSMPPGTVIPELAYGDVRVASDWLCKTFGFQERLQIGDHRSQLVFGDGSVIVVAGSGRQGPTTPAAALPEQAGSRLAHGVTVRVADVDGHYERAKAAGARILSPPETYPYGERQYTAEDPGGHRWTFSQSIADVAPEEWGGQLTGTG